MITVKFEGWWLGLINEKKETRKKIIIVVIVRFKDWLLVLINEKKKKKIKKNDVKIEK